MGAIRENWKGLSCNSEEELDDKLKEFEEQISLGGLTLREEKQKVFEITKLKAQRPQVCRVLGCCSTEWLGTMGFLGNPGLKGRFPIQSGHPLGVNCMN